MIFCAIAGGIDDHDLKEILGYDLGVAVTGTEQIGTTVIVTEGFGDIAMARRTFDLLRQHAGRDVSVNGATQIRAGVLRPEIVICLDQQPAEPETDEGVSATVWFALGAAALLAGAATGALIFWRKRQGKG